MATVTCKFCGVSGEANVPLRRWTCPTCSERLDGIVSEMGGGITAPTRAATVRYTDSGEPAGRPIPTALSFSELRAWQDARIRLLNAAEQELWRREEEK